MCNVIIVTADRTDKYTEIIEYRYRKRRGSREGGRHKDREKGGGGGRQRQRGFEEYVKSSETTEKRLEIITCITKRENQREKAIETTDKCSYTYRYRDRNRQEGEDRWEREEERERD